MVRPPTARSVAVAAALLATAACQLPLPPALSTTPLTAQGYPAPSDPAATPAPTAAPTSTPSADADGFLPPPAQPPSQSIRLADSPHADILIPLQAALDTGDASWFEAHVDAANAGMKLFDIGQLDSEGGTTVDGAGASALAAAFFAAGARPRVQAYFEEQRATTVCLYALTHRWQGTVGYPGYAEDHAITARTSPELPPTVPLDAAALHVCRDGLGAWTLDAWIHGGYYGIIGRLSGYAPPWPLVVIRP